jgi:hypothetical protein
MVTTLWQLQQMATPSTQSDAVTDVPTAFTRPLTDIENTVTLKTDPLWYSIFLEITRRETIPKPEAKISGLEEVRKKAVGEP